MGNNNGMEDFDHVVEKLPALFDTLGENLPKLLKGVKDQLFSPEAGRDLGKAVGSFYKELTESGLDQGQALELTREYMKSLERFSTQMKMGEWSHNNGR